MTDVRPYTSRAIKSTGLLDETRLLLRAWRPGESAADLRRRVRDEGLLGKTTAARAVDVVTHVFNQRFLAAGVETTKCIQQLLQVRGAGGWFDHVCFLLTARNDVVLRDAATRFLPDCVEAGRTTVDTASFEAFLLDREADGHIPKPWSPTVRRRVAQHILGQLSDFGALTKPRRAGVRTILRFEPDPVAVAWLAYDLHFKGVSDGAILEHEDWAVWALGPAAVRENLLHMAVPSLWELQVAGSVAQFTWGCHSMREVVDVLARLDVR
ncbi:Putative inner membrane protein [Stigmatella aurantiaca]|uniref:Putative inner membrane protein n=1 Tax=Stigmatella aurantiaca TaxID=41 RepID=A0A1H8BMH4_STIAU|nr:BrxA family protein [Stigmatella aurantiaca]SEM84090.1 Putative inner membrane protein [Stigmatella aurantiaca]